MTGDERRDSNRRLERRRRKLRQRGDGRRREGVAGAERFDDPGRLVSVDVKGDVIVGVVAGRTKLAPGTDEAAAWEEVINTNSALAMLEPRTSNPDT